MITCQVTLLNPVVIVTDCALLVRHMKSLLLIISEFEPMILTSVVLWYLAYKSCFHKIAQFSIAYQKISDT